jgi:hypothetical protein
MATSRRRIRHPAVSLALFLVICGMGWVAYENRDFFKGEPTKELLTREVKDNLREEIYRSLETDECFLEIRGNLSWRPNDHRYLMDIVISDGELCELRAKRICEHIAVLVGEETGVVATIIAYDQAGRELARRVM